MAGGIAVAYVFVELMPRLGVSQTTLKQLAADSVPLKERHVYLVAFLGFLFFYGSQRISALNSSNVSFWLNMMSYVLLNFLVGYEIVDINDPFIRPLYLFTFALGLHYFITDHSIAKAHPEMYDRAGRFILAFALYLGFIAGILTEIPKTTVIYAVAFVAGGLILNVLSYELPRDQKSQSFTAFALGGILYSMILVYQG